MIDQRVAVSLRNIDALLELGSLEAVAPGIIDSQKRTIDGVHYAVRAFENGDREVRVSVDASGDEPWTLSLPGGPASLRYRYSTDGWATTREVGAVIEGDQADRKVTFAIHVDADDSGRIEGLFHCQQGDFWLRAPGPEGEANFRGYVYTTPDATSNGSKSGWTLSPRLLTNLLEQSAFDRYKARQWTLTATEPSAPPPPLKREPHLQACPSV